MKGRGKKKKEGEEVNNLIWMYYIKIWNVSIWNLLIKENMYYINNGYS